MNRIPHAPRLVALLLLLLLAVVLAGCANDDDGDDGDAATRAETSQTDDGDAADDDGETSSDEPDAPGTATDPGNFDLDDPDRPRSPIRITHPLPFQTVAKRFVLRGSAIAHEGTLNWSIERGDGSEPLASGGMTASCGGPCRGNFSTTIPLAGVPLGSFELRVWSPNVDDAGPERLDETMVPISIHSQIDPNAPGPNTPPPGGAPTSAPAPSTPSD